jgi:hypothetical protein
MLSKTVVNFLYMLLASDKKLPEIISSIGYGERFVVVIDFEIMHKIMICENNYVPSGNEDLIANAKVWTDFVKKLLTVDQSLEMIAHSYGQEQRYYIANVLCDMKTMLLEEIIDYVGVIDEIQFSSPKVNH